MLREILKKSYGLRCISYVLTDIRAGLKGNKEGPAEEHGVTHSGLTTRQSIDYIETVFRDYKTYAGVDRLHGRIAEVGPGDNCGVGLMCLADGCESVDLADRFYSGRDRKAQSAIYAALAARHPGIAEILHFANLEEERSFPRLNYVTGEDAAAEKFFDSPSKYDFILSRAVMEHVYDPVLALTGMSRALKPGGLMLHKVDFRNHGLFAGGFHELKFLEVPGWLYHLMNRHLARPNRALINVYRDCLDKLGLEYRLLVTRLVGSGPVEPHVEYRQINPEVRERALLAVREVHHRLARPFRHLSVEDLSVSRIFIVARKQVG